MSGVTGYELELVEKAVWHLGRIAQSLEDIAVVESEAAAAERERLAALVRGLGRIEWRGQVLLDEHVSRAAVLAILR